ncbi:MAG: TonB-dependent receptor plug domain-containing protein, partial [Deltaproteobacteria bacterium]|nr:TonB-dependent receptor plug domain-containing protein [Deltaproteobacteria bacterium]
MQSVATFIIFFFSTTVFAQDDIGADQQPKRTILFEEKTIEVIRADQKSPIPATTLSKEQLSQTYVGQEMPAIVQHTPSLTWYSDNGGFQGYSYMRLRGIDQTRINFTLNGVPLNDPEDQVIYFSNFPDLLHSIDSIQIQRGVGTSTYGTASFGGSVNMTSEILQKPGYTSVTSSYGSFRTYRLSPAFHTGLINDQWAFYGRYSMQQSDGYRDHAGVSGHSLFFGGGYFSEKHILKLTAFTGRAKTALAYLAVPKSMLETQRRFNPLTPEEVDDFTQSIVMLEYALPIHDNVLFSSTVYLNHADGNYTVWLAPDLYNFGLTSYFYGLSASLQYERPTFDIKIGLHANNYVRYHSAFIAPFRSSQLYKNAGHKNEMAAFVKISKQIRRLGIFTDMQW